MLLSNNWALPFDEVIDWNKAVIWADERLLFQVPEVIHSISDTKLFALRQQSQILWEQYFNTIEKIVFTTFEVRFFFKCHCHINICFHYFTVVYFCYR